MIGQQQAQAHFEPRSKFKQQGSSTAQATLQPRDTQRQPQSETDNRDVAVVAVLGYN